MFTYFFPSSFLNYKLILLIFIFLLQSDVHVAVPKRYVEKKNKTEPDRRNHKTVGQEVGSYYIELKSIAIFK